MNVAVAIDDVWDARLPSASEAGPAPKRIVVAYGFWIFLLERHRDVRGALCRPTRCSCMRPRAVRPARSCSIKSASRSKPACLLASSYTCGLMSLAVGSRRRAGTYLGALSLRARRRVPRSRAPRVRRHDRPRRNPQRSAFLSAFFTLVGCHGLHVTAGLIWLAVMMAQVAVKGFRATVERRLLCFSLFWHALDIIWVWLFTVVYLMGVRP